MDGSDIYKASSSMRASSSGSGMMSTLRSASTSVWRNSGMDVFTKSTREENDEEALKWASLEKLPTFDRLKKGLLFGSTGPSNEVDIDNLGVEDRKHLLDRLVKTADEDNENFLLKLRARLDRLPFSLFIYLFFSFLDFNRDRYFLWEFCRVGIDLPTIEVRYEHVTVEADVNTGSRALPSFINFHIDFFEVRIQSKSDLIYLILYLIFSVHFYVS